MSAGVAELLLLSIGGQQASFIACTAFGAHDRGRGFLINLEISRRARTDTSTSSNLVPSMHNMMSVVRSLTEGFIDQATLTETIRWSPVGERKRRGGSPYGLTGFRAAMAPRGTVKSNTTSREPHRGHRSRREIGE
jgi:hypothetical protein